MDRDWVIIILLGMAFGSALFFNELLLVHMGPFWAGFARVGPAALASWAFVLLTGRNWRAALRQLWAIAILGSMFFWLPLTVYPVGQQYVESGLAGIVNAMTPVFTVVVSHFWPGGEKATRLKMVGVLIGFVGIVALTIPSLEAGAENRLFATLLILLAPLGYAFGFNWVRRIAGVDSIVMLTWAFTFAAIFMFMTAIGFDQVPARLSLEAWGLSAFAGVVLTGFLFQVGFTILPRAGATKTSTLTFIAPITALFLGAMFLNEQLVGAHYVGMAAIFLGLFMIDGSLFRSRGGSANT